MTRKTRQSGVTLVELVVVVAIITILLGIAVPGVKALMRAFRSEDAVLRMVDTALQTARTLAVERGHYVGVRFQKRDSELTIDGDEADDFRRLLDAPQSMLFIEHTLTEDSPWTGEFRTIEGFKPVDLPAGYTLIGGDNLSDCDDDPNLIRNAGAFTVLFSPAGRLAEFDGVRVLGNAPWIVLLSDLTETIGGTAFVGDEGTGEKSSRAQDDLPHLDGLEDEDSVIRFWICHNQRLRQVLGTDIEEDDIETYVEEQAPTCVYVKPLGGTLIVTDPNKTQP